MQIGRNRRACLSNRAWIAPAEARPIEPTSSCLSRDELLKRHIAVAWSTSTRIENHRRASASQTVDIERTPADVDGLADARQSLAVTLLAYSFIHGTRNRAKDDNDRKSSYKPAHRSYLSFSSVLKWRAERANRCPRGEAAQEPSVCCLRCSVLVIERNIRKSEIRALIRG